MTGLKTAVTCSDLLQCTNKNINKKSSVRLYNLAYCTTLLEYYQETKQKLTEKDEGIETFKNKWYDEECKFAIEEMKRAREKWLMKEEGRAGILP